MSDNLAWCSFCKEFTYCKQENYNKQTIGGVVLMTITYKGQCKRCHREMIKVIATGTAEKEADNA